MCFFNICLFKKSSIKQSKKSKVVIQMLHCSFSMIKKQQQQHICGVSKDQKIKEFSF